ncbi:MAG: 2Fe-2S iron-sulfur cluster binding domain-containing protein [Saprospiraceae bacterium]|nr:2Fe-2S iron-sulfur cluster binding domain-containing protein [Saprospiraceae bacterium]
MINSKFFALTISHIVRQSKDCVEIIFDVPQNLKEAFEYQPGQYLTIKKDINSEELRRSYSICSSPYDGKLSIAIKRIKDGRFSTFANEVLKVGDKLDVMPPVGNFQLHANAKNFVFFAAGSGITPIISQIKTILTIKSNANVTLFYGNRNFGSIIFREALESLKNKFIGRLAIHHVFTKEKIGIPLMYGRIDKTKCIEFANSLFTPADVDQYLLCGPAEMIFDVKDALVEQGVSSNKIQFELFNTEGIKKDKSIRNTLEDSDKDKESEVIIQMDGDIFEFSLDYGGQNILDAALAAGADLPFACKGGVCCTCKAKITNGDVVMDLNYALEPDEVAAGYVLLCQSHPRSSNIYIDFDQK